MIKITNVQVMGTEDGNVIVQNPNKPEYGSIAFEQTLFINNKGFWNKRHRVAFTAGKLDELHLLAETTGMYPKMEVPGILYVEESFEPFFPDQIPKCNPTTGNCVTIDGKPVYQKVFYDEDGEKRDKFLEGTTKPGAKLIEPKELIIISTTPSSNNETMRI